MYTTSFFKHPIARIAVLSTALASASLYTITTAQAAAPNTPIKSQYIVVLKPAANRTELVNLAKKTFNGKTVHEYTHVFNGITVNVPDSASNAFLTAMSKNPLVERIEQDKTVSTNLSSQTGAPWGLDRVDQRNLPLNSTFSYDQTGIGVRAYVVDTGVLTSHQEFSGRVLSGYTAINDGNGVNDCNGHGTHVAGTIAGKTVGIAKDALIVPVRVLDCAGSGTNSGVIAGLDWVVANAVKPAVLNMSLGGGASSTLDAAVARAASAGVIPVVAAGNENQNACNVSPAREPSAITVAATDSTDRRASFSNYGSCVDVFAPGVSIKSSWYSAYNAYNTISGTSMASPHVAGVVATYLQAQPSASTQTMTDILLSNATTTVVTDTVGSPNKLVYSIYPNTTPPVSVYVNALGATNTSTKTGWKTTVTTSIYNSNGQPVSAAKVVGSFSVGGTNLSCTTNTLGQCQISSGTLSNKTVQTQFTVNNVSGSNMLYTSSANKVTSLIIAK